MLMPRTHRLLLASVLSSFLLAGTAQADDPIVIGAATASSGWMAPYDEGPTAAAQVAVDEINEHGGVLGRQLKFVHLDTKTDRAEAARVASDLVKQKASLIIVSADFDMGGPSALVANQAKVISFSTNGADIKLGNKAIGPYVFTAATDAQGSGALLADWGYKEKHWKTAYILTDVSLEYTKSVARGFKERWTQLAGAASLLGEDSYKNDDASVAAQISRIAALPNKPDVIALAAVIPGLPSVLRQLRAAGINTPIVGGVGYDGDEWHAALPPAALNDVYYGSYSSARGDDPRPEIKEFLGRYAARNGGKPPASGGLAVSGYSVVYAWKLAAERAKSTESAAVLAQLEKFKDEPLLVGPTSYSDKLHTNLARPTLIFDFVEGKPKPLGYFDPRTGGYVEWWKH
jgi:branched-chain amino acid transport system substrate-binding protein